MNVKQRIIEACKGVVSGALSLSMTLSLMTPVMATEQVELVEESMVSMNTNDIYTPHSVDDFSEEVFEDGQIYVPFFLQRDSRWSDMQLRPASTNVMRSAGCGVASFAMIAQALGAIYREEGWTPGDFVSFFGNGYYSHNLGSLHDGIHEAAIAYGFEATKYLKNEMTEEILRESLEDGKLVSLLIATPSYGQVIANTKGHLVVIRGIAENGDFMIADPGWDENNDETFSWSVIHNNAKSSHTATYTVIDGPDKIWTNEITEEFDIEHFEYEWVEEEYSELEDFEALEDSKDEVQTSRARTLDGNSYSKALMIASLLQILDGTEFELVKALENSVADTDF